MLLQYFSPGFSRFLQRSRSRQTKNDRSAHIQSAMDDTSNWKKNAYSRFIRAFCGWVGIGLAGFSVMSFSTIAQAVKPKAYWEWKEKEFALWLTGQYRPRFEFMQRRDLESPGNSLSSKDNLFINHRARLAVGGRTSKYVTFFLQLQDVRQWGTSPNDFRADGFDLYRGWIEATLAGPLSIKAGRMELVYDGKRLLGNADWRPQARSFDAIQIKVEPKDFKFHAIYSKLSASGDPASESHLAVAWFHYRAMKVFQPSVYYMLHYQPADSQYRHTTGFYLKGRTGAFSYTGELFLQFGSLEFLGQSRDIFAWLGAASVTYQLLQHPSEPKLVVWAELISGQDEGATDGTVRSFVTTFGNNHKHYGLMDFFLNIPAHTRNAGLVDSGIGFRVKPPINGLFARLDIHYFRLFSPLTNPTGDKVQNLGVEFDLILKYTIQKGYLYLLAIYGLMLPFEDGGFTALGKGNGAESWFAFHVDLKF